MNPYTPPRTPPRKQRKSAGGDRSPAEAAFDFVFFPSVLYFALAAFSSVVGSVQSEGERIIEGGLSHALHAIAVLALIHWLFAVRRVYRSWSDPFGKVLRFVSAFLLLSQAGAVAVGLLL